VLTVLPSKGTVREYCAPAAPWKVISAVPSLELSDVLVGRAAASTRQAAKENIFVNCIMKRFIFSGRTESFGSATCEVKFKWNLMVLYTQRPNHKLVRELHSWVSASRSRALAQNENPNRTLHFEVFLRKVLR